MYKIPFSYLCAGLILVASAASNAQNNTEQSANQHNKECGDINLYREANETQRKTTLSPVDEPVLLSPSYCVGIADLETTPINQLPTKLTHYQALAMFARYNSVWRTLSDAEEKTAFAHLFLKRLSQKMMVLPLTSTPNELNILLPVAVGKHGVTFTQQNITASAKDYPETYQKLLNLSQKTPEQVVAFEMKWTSLDPLVKAVIKGERSDTTDNATLMEGSTNNSCGRDVVCADNHDNDIYYGDAYNDLMAYGWDPLEDERAQCSVNHPYCTAKWVPTDGYDEHCIVVTYPDGTVITGLYCELLD